MIKPDSIIAGVLFGHGCNGCDPDEPLGNWDIPVEAALYLMSLGAQAQRENAIGLNAKTMEYVSMHFPDPDMLAVLKKEAARHD